LTIEYSPPTAACAGSRRFLKVREGDSLQTEEQFMKKKIEAEIERRIALLNKARLAPSKTERDSGHVWHSVTPEQAALEGLLAWIRSLE
jgi:hypothetical protein